MSEVKACAVSEIRQPAGEAGSPDGYRDEFLRHRRKAEIGQYGQTLIKYEIGSSQIIIESFL